MANARHYAALTIIAAMCSLVVMAALIALMWLWDTHSLKHELKLSLRGVTSSATR